MSIRYKLASAALRAAGTKKLFALPEEELLEKVRGMNRRRQFQMPKDHKAVYGDRLILGQYHWTKEDKKGDPVLVRRWDDRRS